MHSRPNSNSSIALHVRLCGPNAHSFSRVPAVTGEFDDLLAANRRFAESFKLSGFDGVAHAGVAVVTCMDSRIDPLRMFGLKPGDAKIFRNPGGRVTAAALEASSSASTCSGCIASSWFHTPNAQWC